MRDQTGFLSDNRGVDTIPLKMVVYLTITAVILVLMVTSWSNISPFIEGADVDRQLKDAGLGISSIQDGYARDLEATGQDGSMCTVSLSMSDNVRYVAFGVDPDPDMDGNLTNSGWMLENNTILCQYVSDVKERTFLEGDPVRFRKGVIDVNGKWVIDGDLAVNPGHYQGVVIEGPIEGDFVFELVRGDEIFTLSHF
ncbi:MAG: hypothetical protein U9N13_07685 [Euryarchaeota archaeon]|nr:hypothetical protein [Euryarchaeota archaeon]